MRKIVVTSKFSKDMRRVAKSPRFQKYAFKLESYVQLLQTGEKLPPEARNHSMSKASPREYSGCYDFHVAPDICVVYRMDKDTIELVRIGQHNNLGLTENLD